MQLSMFRNVIFEYTLTLLNPNGTTSGRQSAVTVSPHVSGKGAMRGEHMKDITIHENCSVCQTRVNESISRAINGIWKYGSRCPSHLGFSLSLVSRTTSYIRYATTLTSIHIHS